MAINVIILVLELLFKSYPVAYLSPSKVPKITEDNNSSMAIPKKGPLVKYFNKLYKDNN